MTKREQVANQCAVVAVLAKSIASVYDGFTKIFRATSDDNQIINQVGERTARLMEVLGDTLNGIDAVDDDAEWMTPIFHAAHETWPIRGHECPHCGQAPVDRQTGR